MLDYVCSKWYQVVSIEHCSTNIMFIIQRMMLLSKGSQA